VEEPVCIMIAPLLPAVANPVAAVILPETPASPAFAVDSDMPPLLELVERPEEISTEPPVAVSDDEPDWVPAEIVTLPATLVSPAPARTLILPLLPPVAAPDPIRMEPVFPTVVAPVVIAIVPLPPTGPAFAVSRTNTPLLVP